MNSLVLLYHRVAEVEADPQLLCVTPEHFTEHLEILRGQDVALTFDDGYVDNLSNAKPLLEKFDCPATVFVTSGAVGQNREFWWDELERILLPPGDWNVLEKSDPSTSHSMYRNLCPRLQSLPPESRQYVLEQLTAGASARPTHRPLSEDEVRRLADGGLVTIGSQGVTHSVLSALPEADQKTEIEESKARLEEITGLPVTRFAYPFGDRSDYTSATIGLVREAGYTLAFSNFPGRIDRSTDRFQLPRHLVRDWNGEEFARRLQGWLRCAS